MNPAAIPEAPKDVQGDGRWMSMVKQRMKFNATLGKTVLFSAQGTSLFRTLFVFDLDSLSVVT